MDASSSKPTEASAAVTPVPAVLQPPADRPAPAITQPVSNSATGSTQAFAPHATDQSSAASQPLQNATSSITAAQSSPGLTSGNVLVRPTQAPIANPAALPRPVGDQTPRPGPNTTALGQGQNPVPPPVSTVQRSQAPPANGPLSQAPAANGPRPQPVPQPPPPQASAQQIAELRRKRNDNIAAMEKVCRDILWLLGKLKTHYSMRLTADKALLDQGQRPYWPTAAEYWRLRASFDQLRMLYQPNPHASYIFVEHLGITDPAHIATLRKANEVSYCSAIYAGGIGQLELDQSFLSIFVPIGGKLLGRHAAIWLEFKTQAFVNAVRSNAAPAERVMADLFPAGIVERLLSRRPGSNRLCASEQVFVNSYEARKKTLQDLVDRKALLEPNDLFAYENLGNSVKSYLMKTHVKPFVKRDPAKKAKRIADIAKMREDFGALIEPEMMAALVFARNAGSEGNEDEDPENVVDSDPDDESLLRPKAEPLTNNGLQTGPQQAPYKQATPNTTAGDFKGFGPASEMATQVRQLADQPLLTNGGVKNEQTTWSAIPDHSTLPNATGAAFANASIKQESPGRSLTESKTDARLASTGQADPTGPEIKPSAAPATQAS